MYEWRSTRQHTSNVQGGDARDSYGTLDGFHKSPGIMVYAAGELLCARSDGFNQDIVLVFIFDYFIFQAQKVTGREA